MKLNDYLSANLHNLIFFAESGNEDDSTDQSNIDTLGVGAVMPQDVPELTFLADTELYGI
jgi:hypothetical protein